MEELSKRIEELTLELTGILGVVGTKEENDVTERVFSRFGEMEYFKNNPDNLKYVELPNDKLGRKSVVATIKGNKGNSNKTVILIGHTDTVGISDYGDIKEYATKPLELIDRLKKVTISEEARADLESGKYLFGRGIFDMKCGVSTLMIILEELSKDLDNLEGNLIFAAVPDEEGNSGGMLTVVPELIKMREENKFDYQAVIDTDYAAPRYIGDENRYVYVGTVGKLMPSFYVVGKETHVGEPYKGLDPNQIAAEITREFNLNTKYCDIADGEVSLPPVTLRQQDLKPEYSVQIARSSYLYLNYATHSSTPDQVMEKMISGATIAFENVINDLNAQYEIYADMNKYPYERLPWKARVISYYELLEKVREERGKEVDNRIDVLSQKLKNDPTVDERLFSLKIVEEVHNMWSDKDPVVIAYFSPPYYPHIFVKGDEAKEMNLLNAVDEAISMAGNKFDIVRKKFYPYISDLSYAAAPREDKAVESLKGNMPGFGISYDLPLNEMQQLNLPVVNIGPFGKDAHKFTERLEKEYSFNVVPGIVMEVIRKLLMQ